MAVFTPAGFAEALRKFGHEIDKPIVLGIRRGLTAARTEYVKRFRTRGLGRSIFGKKASGARLLVKRMRVRRDGDRFTGGLELKGLAALQEEGGRTKAHFIKAKNARVLAFQAGGGTAFARSVKHPGAQLQRIPAAGAAMEATAPRFAAEIDKGIQAYINQRLG